MKINRKLQQRVARAVRTSMQIEGYAPTKSPAIKAKAKAIMEAHRVQVPIRGK
jgi:hypothetical protein